MLRYTARFVIMSKSGSDASKISKLAKIGLISVESRGSGDTILRLYQPLADQDLRVI